MQQQQGSNTNAWEKPFDNKHSWSPLIIRGSSPNILKKNTRTSNRFFNISIILSTLSFCETETLLLGNLKQRLLKIWTETPQNCETWTFIVGAPRRWLDSIAYLHCRILLRDQNYFLKTWFLWFLTKSRLWKLWTT